MKAYRNNCIITAALFIAALLWLLTQDKPVVAAALAAIGLLSGYRALVLFEDSMIRLGRF